MRKEKLQPRREYLFGPGWLSAVELQEKLNISMRVVAIEEKGHTEDVRAYFVETPKGVILFDLTMGVANARALLPKNKPVVVLLTHTDWDHTGCIQDFGEENDEVYTINSEYARDRLNRGWSPQEMGLRSQDFSQKVSQRKLNAFRIAPFNAAKTFSDGEKLSFFGLDIEVIATPGHTPDSTCFLIPELGLLLTGDTVYPATHDLRDPANVELWLQSLIRLEKKTRGRAQTLLSGHNESVAQFDLLTRHIQAMSGKLTPNKVEKSQDGTYERRIFGDFSFIVSV